MGNKIKGSVKTQFWGDTGVEINTPSDIEIPLDDAIQVESNHIYFYKDVNSSSILELNKILHQKTNELLQVAREIGGCKPIIYLHINSGGGRIFDGVAAMDTILRLKKEIDIVTVIDGMCASASTFISVVGSKRIMHKHAYMLIHELSGMSWGKYGDLKDDMQNYDAFMEMIKKIYKKYTRVPQKNIDKILKHDIWWDSKTCLKMGLVDEIWG